MWSFFGGGLAGCECAIHLGQEGRTVHIVEMRDALAPDANVRHRPLLLKEVEKYATVHTGCRGLEVRPDGIWCEDKEGHQFLVPGKSVIAALGQRSCTDIVEELQDGAPFVRIIGDAPAFPPSPMPSTGATTPLWISDPDTVCSGGARALPPVSKRTVGRGITGRRRANALTRPCPFADRRYGESNLPERLPPKQVGARRFATATCGA